MSSDPIRVFLVDDHPLVREWLANLLRMERDFTVEGGTSDPAVALELLSAHACDVAVVDLSLKRGSGLQLIKDLQSRLPAIRILVLSMHEDIGDVERAFRAGARGYVMKSESTGQIVAAIREVRAGRIFANPGMLALLADRLVSRPPRAAGATPETLSDREFDVFRRMGEGHSTRRIADDLGVSQNTVQTYCARIKEKLGLGDGTELLQAAFLWHESQLP